MKADTLKKSILQWAIEGKLVPQLESEPEVSQIGEAPEDVPFSIPEKWKWVKLDFVVNLENGDRGSNYPAKSKLTTKNTGLPFVSAINLQNNKISTKNLLYLTDKQFSQLRSGHIKSGDCLYCIRGSIGKFGFADADGGAIASSLVILRVKKYISREYFSTVISSSCIKNQIQYSRNGSAQPNLGAKVFAGFLIPLPPLEEQHRIVAKLNELLPLVETYGQEQEALEKLEKEFPDKLRASLLQEAIQGKLVPQLESEPEVEQIGEAPEDVPFAIPEKWKWVRVSDVAHTNPKVTAQTSSTEVSFIPMAALSAGYTSQITLDAKRSWGTVKNGYTRFTDGDVLLAKITPCFQNRKSTIAKKLSNGIGCGSSEFHVLRVSKEYVTQEYLLMFLKSQWFITYGVENFKGTAGQQRLGTSDLKNCLFPLPPLSEQHRIVEELNELLGSVSQLEHTVSVP